MSVREQIPEICICHTCGQPMKVIDLLGLAESLGFRMPKEDAWVIRCCDGELTIEDDDEALRIRDLLIKHHGRVFPLL